MTRTATELSEMYEQADGWLDRSIEDRMTAEDNVDTAEDHLSIAEETEPYPAEAVASHKEAVRAAKRDLRRKTDTVERAYNGVRAVDHQYNCADLAVRQGGGGH